MIDYDIASHNGLAAVGLCAIDTFLAKALNGFAQYVDRFSGCVATALFFDELFDLAGYNQNVCHNAFPPQDSLSRIAQLEIKGKPFAIRRSALLAASPAEGDNLGLPIDHNLSISLFKTTV